MAHSFIYPGLHYLMFLAFKKAGDLPTEPDHVCRPFPARRIFTYHGLFRLPHRSAAVGQENCGRGRAASGDSLDVSLHERSKPHRNGLRSLCHAWFLFGLKSQDEGKLPQALLAGVFLGLAFVIRSQTILFAGGMGAWFSLRAGR